MDKIFVFIGAFLILYPLFDMAGIKLINPKVTDPQYWNKRDRGQRISCIMMGLGYFLIMGMLFFKHV